MIKKFPCNHTHSFQFSLVNRNMSKRVRIHHYLNLLCCETERQWCHPGELCAWSKDKERVSQSARCHRPSGSNMLICYQTLAFQRTLEQKTELPLCVFRPAHESSSFHTHSPLQQIHWIKWMHFDLTPRSASFYMIYGRNISGIIHTQWALYKLHLYNPIQSNITPLI